MSGGDIDTRELQVLGVRTRVLESGAGGDEEAVVLLHGGPGSANDWDDLLPEVGGFARAVAFDLPGFGRADKPADADYSPHEYATFLAATLSELGIRRAHLVMGDIGGAAGLFWGAAHPEAFASAVMLGVGVLVGYRWHAVARLQRTSFLGPVAARAGRLGFHTVMRIYERAPRRLPKEVIERWWRDYDWGTRRAILRFWRSTPPSAIERLAPTLGRLDRPALVVWGRHDRFVSVEQAEHQRKSFPSCEVIVFEQSGHYPQLDDPDRAANAVLPFLRRQLGAPI
jgi:pimeloyl-ACP methyl ester carboxylesterase